MKIVDFFASDNREHWLSEINKSDWAAGKKDIHGEDSRVYITEIVHVDYDDVLGNTVSGTIDRQLGSAHPVYQ